MLAQPCFPHCYALLLCFWSSIISSGCQKFPESNEPEKGNGDFWLCVLAKPTQISWDEVDVLCDLRAFSPLSNKMPATYDSSGSEKKRVESI